MIITGKCFIIINGTADRIYSDEGRATRIHWWVFRLHLFQYWQKQQPLAEAKGIGRAPHMAWT